MHHLTPRLCIEKTLQCVTNVNNTQAWSKGLKQTLSDDNMVINVSGLMIK